jgi:hypothetical protein
MGPQVPSAPLPLSIVEQASQRPVHIVLQQTPSIQLPLKQSTPPEQVCPLLNLHVEPPPHAPFMHSFCGSSPALMGPHVPSVPWPLSVAVQALQFAVHAVSQQTPSTQWLLEHWLEPAHVAPFAKSATHELFEQKYPVVQSESPVHEVLQAFMTHAYPVPQAVVPLSTQVPMLLHVSALTWLLPMHAGGAHSVPEGTKTLVGHEAAMPVQVSATSHTPAAIRQTVPIAAKPSVGQLAAMPVHVSATSHVPAAMRQTVPIAAKPSVGQLAAMPVQVSATSHAPAAMRQTVPMGLSSSLGHVADIPVQRSSTSQSSVAMRQTVFDGLKPSVGQVADEPVQVSATSHTPATARQDVPAAAKPFVGHAVAEPLHVSATSQIPADARHVVPAERGTQVPFIIAPVATLQAWQSVGSPLPQAELQQTPSLQNPDKQSAFIVQATPRSNLHMLDPLQDPFMHSSLGSVPLMIGPHVPSVPCPATVAEHAWHVPVHAVLQQTPSTQKLLKQLAAPGQETPSADLQFPFPSQDWFVPEQVPTSSWSNATLVQVPTVPDRLHAWQVASHAELQQTLSAQKPLRHSELVEQAAAISFLHVPIPSQDWFAPVQAGTPLASSWPEGTLEQTPTALGTLQDLQVPLQAMSQHTPSKHWPLMHWLPAVHVLPSLSLHAPVESQAFMPEQTFVGFESSPAVMFVHVPTLPMALHVRQAAVHAVAQQTPSMQKPLVHSADIAHIWPSSFLHVPRPSHEFVPIQPGKSSFALGTFVHVPTLPATLQALHVPAHVALQQTPSTQKPLKQSPAAPQTAPLIFLQAPAPLQTVPPVCIHAVLTGSNGFEGLPCALHVSCVHWLPSTGRSLGSTDVTMLPMPSHSMTLQSMLVCPMGKSVPVSV